LHELTTDCVFTVLASTHTYTVMSTLEHSSQNRRTSSIYSDPVRFVRLPFIQILGLQCSTDRERPQSPSYGSFAASSGAMELHLHSPVLFSRVACTCGALARSSSRQLCIALTCARRPCARPRVPGARRSWRWPPAAGRSRLRAELRAAPRALRRRRCADARG